MTDSNRIALRLLITRYDLTNQDVADMLEKSVSTVNQWTSHGDVNISNQLLELLEFKLANRSSR